MPGREFDVVTISIDPTEGPELARRKKQNVLQAYGRPEAGSGWHFLTGRREPIAAVADAVGFRFRFVEDTGEYAHPSAVFVLTPDGRVLPCHGAAELPLEFWSLREHSLRECWEDAPGMNAYRGEAWMREPCRSCDRRTKDHGGCRCQAFALTGDAAVTDPACGLSPDHHLILAAREAAARHDEAFLYRSGRVPALP